MSSGYHSLAQIFQVLNPLLGLLDLLIHASHGVVKLHVRLLVRQAFEILDAAWRFTKSETLPDVVPSSFAICSIVFVSNSFASQSLLVNLRNRPVSFLAPNCLSFTTGIPYSFILRCNVVLLTPKLRAALHTECPFPYSTSIASREIVTLLMG